MTLFEKREGFYPELAKKPFSILSTVKKAEIAKSVFNLTNTMTYGHREK